MGHEKDVLKFDQTSKQWVNIGQMTTERQGHAMSLMPLADAKKICISPEIIEEQGKFFAREIAR